MFLRITQKTKTMKELTPAQVEAKQEVLNFLNTKVTKHGKSEILRAMRRILKEYRNETHSSRVVDCSLCKLYGADRKPDCQNCLMNIFTDVGNYGCVDRYCKPIPCLDVKLSKVSIELDAVIMFYERSIAHIESLSEAQVRRTNFSFLKKIDEQVAIEHGLIEK